MRWLDISRPHRDFSQYIKRKHKIYFLFYIKNNSDEDEFYPFVASVILPLQYLPSQGYLFFTLLQLGVFIERNSCIVAVLQSVTKVDWPVCTEYLY